MYGQARDVDFMCRSLTLAGGLLLLIWGENDKQRNTELMGTGGMSLVEEQPGRRPPADERPRAAHVRLLLPGALRRERRAAPNLHEAVLLRRRHRALAALALRA